MEKIDHFLTTLPRVTASRPSILSADLGRERGSGSARVSTTTRGCSGCDAAVMAAR
jgi:hypothetical protein